MALNQNFKQFLLRIYIQILAFIFLSIFVAKFTTLTNFFIISSLGIVAVGYTWLLTRKSYSESLVVLRQPITRTGPNNVGKQFSIIVLSFMPIIAGLAWGLGTYALTINYGLKEYGTASYATIEKYEFYQSSKEYSIDVYITYDGHEGLLRAYTSKRYGPYDGYNELLSAAQYGQKVPVHYFKAFPSFVRTDVQMGLDTKLPEENTTDANRLPVMNAPSNSLQDAVGQ